MKNVFGTSQHTRLPSWNVHYQICRGRALETCIPGQWSLTKILSQLRAPTVPGDQSQWTWSRATGVCAPGYNGGRQENLHSLDRLLSPREKQVWLTGGIDPSSAFCVFTKFSYCVFQVQGVPMSAHESECPAGFLWCLVLQYSEGVIEKSSSPMWQLNKNLSNFFLLSACWNL